MKTKYVLKIFMMNNQVYREYSDDFMSLWTTGLKEIGLNPWRVEDSKGNEVTMTDFENGVKNEKLSVK